ncbi:MAG: hypothetical protein OHK0038_07110 [Flammeovirgaceae bacterium]
MKYFFTFIIYLFLNHFTFAQINEGDTLLLQAKLSFTGNWQTGNVELFVLRSKIDISFAPSKNIVFKTQNAYFYQEFYKKKADEDIFSRNFIYFKPQNRVYPFLIGFVSKNYRRKIDSRYFYGAGATFQIIKKSNHILKFALSGVYEQTDFSKNDFNEEQYDGKFQINTWRATSWIFGKHYFLKKKVILHYEAYIQPSIENKNNFRWQTEAGLDIPLWKGLNFTSNYIYTYEKIIIQNLKNKDSIMTFGLSYQFKK